MRSLFFLTAAAILLAACSDQVSPPATPTASPAATAIPLLTLGPAIELPPHVALLLETGCFQCDGPATGLIRVSRSADGAAHRELLVSAGAHLLYGEEAGQPQFFAGDLPIPRETIETEKGTEQYEPYVTGIAASADGSEVVVSVCVYPGCGVGKEAEFPPGRVVLYRSTDAGETWTEFGAIAGGTVLGIVSPGTVLAMSHVSPDGPPDVFLYPGLEPISRPPSAGGVFQPPVVLADGTIAWPERGGSLVRPDGSVIVTLPQIPGIVGPFTIGAAVQQGFGDRLIAVYWLDSGPAEAPFLSLFHADGAHIRTVRIDRYIIGNGWAWVSDSALAGSIDVSAEDLPEPPPEFYPGILPALIELSSGTIHPVTSPFLEPGAETGRNFVRGVQSLDAAAAAGKCAPAVADAFAEAQAGVTFTAFCPSFLPDGFGIDRRAYGPNAKAFEAGRTPPSSLVVKLANESAGAELSFGQGYLGGDLFPQWRQYPPPSPSTVKYGNEIADFYPAYEAGELGMQPSVVLIWDLDGWTHLMMAKGVDRETLLEIAASMTPLGP